mmetsp:Transcript_16588/g.54414  ORF Transcript_16588/g.54414 Transcript_16588/m.54414 type:complete len:301 (+) Transcript_16588:683-1585(+)
MPRRLAPHPQASGEVPRRPARRAALVPRRAARVDRRLPPPLPRLGGVGHGRRPRLPRGAAPPPSRRRREEALRGRLPPALAPARGPLRRRPPRAPARARRPRRARTHAARAGSLRAGAPLSLRRRLRRGPPAPVGDAAAARPAEAKGEGGGRRSGRAALLAEGWRGGPGGGRRRSARAALPGAAGRAQGGRAGGRAQGRAAVEAAAARLRHRDCRAARADLLRARRRRLGGAAAACVRRDDQRRRGTLPSHTLAHGFDPRRAASPRRLRRAVPRGGGRSRLGRLARLRLRVDKGGRRGGD